MRSAVRSFSRYVPKEIVHQLLAQNKEIRLGGEKKDVTVFFSDIANSTSIFEEHSTDELMELLAEYFDGLSKIILEAQGTIDKYIGDSIMAFWGAPLPLPNHVAVCVGCSSLPGVRPFVQPAPRVSAPASLRLALAFLTRES